MNFENKLISGLFIKRYKRFFVDIKINNKIITAHCPNTGSMYGLLKKGNKVWVSKSENPNRKLKYTLEIIEDQKAKVGVNTHSTNKIVHHALNNNLIKELKNSLEIKPETKFGKNTRFDFLVINKNFKAFVEVKNVTLSRDKKKAEFPDAVTARGLKHINELMNASKKKFNVSKKITFKHNKKYLLPDGRILIACYHPSPRNINTKVVTSSMINQLFRKAKKIANF